MEQDKQDALLEQEKLNEASIINEMELDQQKKKILSDGVKETYDGSHNDEQAENITATSSESNQIAAVGVVVSWIVIIAAAVVFLLLNRCLSATNNETDNAYDDDDVTTVVVDEQADENGSLTSYFKEHIGQMVCDFDMFNDLRVKTRLINLMGDDCYFALKEIYQTQVDIEYTDGMFWSFGFMAHQCCDPATVWAYDTFVNDFYIWIRKDGEEYWWSESGNIPFKFRELVSEKF